MTYNFSEFFKVLCHWIICKNGGSGGKVGGGLFSSSVLEFCPVLKQWVDTEHEQLGRLGIRGVGCAFSGCKNQ